MTDEPDDTNAAIELAKSLHPLLAGKPSPVIGAALIDLVSLMIAGHIGETPLQTQKVRTLLLDEHMKGVLKMIPLQDAMIKQRMEQQEPRLN